MSGDVGIGPNRSAASTRHDEHDWTSILLIRPAYWSALLPILTHVRAQVRVQIVDMQPAVLAAVECGVEASAVDNGDDYLPGIWAIQMLPLISLKFRMMRSGVMAIPIIGIDTPATEIRPW